MKRLIPILILLCGLVPLAAARDLPRRAWFGAQLSPVSDSLRAATGQAFEGGLLLGQIIPNSSAEAAGLLAGDILVSFDGNPVPSVPEFIVMLKSSKTNKTIRLEYIRGTERKATAVRFKEYPRETPEEFEILYESVNVDGDLRRVILTKPVGKGPFPAVVLMGGLGCYSVDVAPPTPFAYREILYALTREGFATVRLEKTGMGDSEGPPCAEQSFFDEVHGHVAALKEYGRFKFLDMDKVIYFGHSMGGLVAPVVYREVPCAGICAVATSGIDWFEYELINQRRQLVLSEVPYDSIEIMQQEKKRAMNLLFMQRKSPDEVIAADSLLADDIAYPAHHTFMQEVANLNLASYWKDVDCPVRFIYGTADFITAAGEHEYARDIVNAFHPGRADYVEVEGMDHYFVNSGDQAGSFANLVAGLPNNEFDTSFLEPLIGFCKTAAGL